MKFYDYYLSKTTKVKGLYICSVNFLYSIQATRIFSNIGLYVVKNKDVADKLKHLVIKCLAHNIISASSNNLDYKCSVEYIEPIYSDKAVDITIGVPEFDTDKVLRCNIQSKVVSDFKLDFNFPDYSKVVVSIYKLVKCFSAYVPSKGYFSKRGINFVGDTDVINGNQIALAITLIDEFNNSVKILEENVRDIVIPLAKERCIDCVHKCTNEDGSITLNWYIKDLESDFIYKYDLTRSYNKGIITNIESTIHFLKKVLIDANHVRNTDKFKEAKKDYFKNISNKLLPQITL